MKKALPIHVVALIAAGFIALWVNNVYLWERPWALLFMLLSVGYAAKRAWGSARFGNLYALVSFSSEASNLQSLPDLGRAQIAEFPYALRTFAIALLAIAIARPQSSNSIEDMTSEGIDLVLAMDVSASMLSMDFKPNRLEQAKLVAVDFINARPHDRIGVVAYEGESFTQVPVTSDHIVVKNGVMDLQTGLLEGGTAIGMGLATAVNRLRKSEAKSRVIILLTDGVNNAGSIDPSDAAQLAELNGIRVYTIGVGSVGKAKSPVAKMGDTYRYDWIDVRIDEEILMEIAERTGGKYFRATNTDKLKAIYEEIDILEKTRFNVLRYQRKTEAYIPFALMAMSALVLERLLRFTVIRSIS
ncbi:MAG TPA: VWA domain-containing protein [Flavobacteriales bacterium]|nr:VWA domain-containing protein [Flavobacteriales bacterium]HIO59228.1 VWA domain-containing protein [Flavobacteriales bacterium]